MNYTPSSVIATITHPDGWDYISNISTSKSLDELLSTTPSRTEVKPKRWWRKAKVVETYRSDTESSVLYHYAMAFEGLYSILTGDEPPTAEQVKHVERRLRKANLCLTGTRPLLEINKGGFLATSYSSSKLILQAIRVLCCANWGNSGFHARLTKLTDKLKEDAQILLDELHYRGILDEPRSVDTRQWLLGYNSYGDYDEWFPASLAWSDFIVLGPISELPSYDITYSRRVGSVTIPKLSSLVGDYRPKITSEVGMLLMSLSKVDASSLDNVHRYLSDLPKGHRVTVDGERLILSTLDNPMIVQTADNTDKVYEWLNKYYNEWASESIDRFGKRIDKHTGVMDEYLTCGLDLGYHDVIYIPVWSETPTQLERSLYLRNLYPSILFK